MSRRSSTRLAQQNKTIEPNSSFKDKVAEVMTLITKIKEEIQDPATVKIHPISSSHSNFQCDIDGQIFITKQALTIHMSSHLAPMVVIHYNLDELKCEVCSKTFASAKKLEKHEQIHNKCLKCPKCKRKFAFKSHLDTHKRQYHINPLSFKCEVCGNKFNQKSHLQLHLKVHQEYREKTLKCERCPYSTDIKGHLKSHYRTHEKQDKRFEGLKDVLECEICKKLCKKDSLRMHMKTVHRMDKSMLKSRQIKLLEPEISVES